jgi:hypothetical protein
MITPVNNFSIPQIPAGQWYLARTALPEPGKWVLVRTAAYQRIARFENGLWRTVDGRQEPKPVISWQEIC